MRRRELGRPTGSHVLPDPRPRLDLGFDNESLQPGSTVGSRVPVLCDHVLRPLWSDAENAASRWCRSPGKTGTIRDSLPWTAVLRLGRHPPNSTVAFAIVATGTGPFIYQWGKAGAPLNTVTKPSTATPTRGPLGGCRSDSASCDGIVSNTCGAATSGPATLTVCAADFNCDGFVDCLDYDEFVVAFESGSTTPSTDFNGDGTLGSFDAFVRGFESPCRANATSLDSTTFPRHRSRRSLGTALRASMELSNSPSRHKPAETRHFVGRRATRPTPGSTWQMATFGLRRAQGSVPSPARRATTSNSNSSPISRRLMAFTPTDASSRMNAGV